MSHAQLARLNYNKLRHEREKKLPPNIRDIISEETIEMFDNFGTTGWKFVCDQLLKGNQNL